MSDDRLPAAPSGEFVLYRTEDGRTRISVRLEDQTLWLTQAGIAELFQTTPQNVTLRLAAIYQEGDLQETATCKDHLQVRQEGTRQVRRHLKQVEKIKPHAPDQKEPSRK